MQSVHPWVFVLYYTTEHSYVFQCTRNHQYGTSLKKKYCVKVNYLFLHIINMHDVKDSRSKMKTDLYKMVVYIREMRS